MATTDTAKSKKPPNTAFRQQRLRAWQPLLTPRTVLPTFFLIGVLFAPLGALLLLTSESITDITIDYTDCYKLDPNAGGGGNGTAPPPGGGWKDVAASHVEYHIPGSGAYTIPTPRYRVSPATAVDDWTGLNYPTLRCTVEFAVPVDIKPPVFFYYRLSNFYQNHRKYVKSYDAAQLLGTARSRGQLAAGGCGDLPGPDASDKVYYPCGFIANSVFNDTFYNLSTVGGGVNGTVFQWRMDSGLAWPSDGDRYAPTTYTDFANVLPPPNMASRFPGGVYTAETIQKVHKDEHFRVWMRTAGLPAFRKLYGRSDQTLVTGNYSMAVDLNFNVTAYGGTKAFVISTTGFIGGRNNFLGIAYIIVGCVCVLLGCGFSARHFWKPRKLGDHSYLSWNQPGVAVPSGSGEGNGSGGGTVGLQAGSRA